MTLTIHEMAARSVQTRMRMGHYVYQTPVIPARQGRGEILFKAENLQYTGSFKFRGAMAKLSAMEDEIQFITASSGNHGLASAQAAQIMDKKLKIVLPHNVAPAKLAKIKSYPIEVILAGEESGAAEIYARQLAAQDGMHYISPYNDLEIVAGQGTIGLELLEQCETIDNVFVAMGGGGLVSGIGCVLKAFSPHTKIYGVAAKNSNALAQAMREGRVVETWHKPTLADGVAGGVDEDTLTLPLALATIDQVIECEEEEIEAALRQFGREENMLIEGAAALALAGFNQIRQQCYGKSNVIVLCGGNFDQRQIAEIVYAAL